MALPFNIIRFIARQNQLRKNPGIKQIHDLNKQIKSAHKKLEGGKPEGEKLGEGISQAMKVSGYPLKGGTDKIAKNWTMQNVSKGTGTKIKNQIPSQLRDRIASPMQKITRAVSENAGPSALGASSIIGGVGAYGLYNLIQNWIDSGDLDEEFDDADLERLLMEAGYDADELDNQEEVYSGDDEDEKFLSSYIRGGQTGLRNEQGDFMTAEQAKEEYKKLYGSK